MKLTRRLFLCNTAAGAVVATTAAAAGAPIRSPREQAIWHLRELERLVKADGATQFVVTVCGNNYQGSKCRRPRILQIDEGGDLYDNGKLFGSAS